eukprot:maker-scaffold_13-snap-gene-2.1-mRNA-1 protein AED:0.01 eAED:0.01 QI:60/1/1/1/1/1/2/434/292
MDKMKSTFADSGARATFLEQNKLYIISYTILFAAVLFVYHLLSDGDFSFLLTLASIVLMFGLSLLLVKLNLTKSHVGISLKTVALYALVFMCRLTSILFYEGYLPFDASGDWLYQAVEVTSLVLCLAIMGWILSMEQPYDYALDGFGRFKNVPPQLSLLVLIVPCLVLALIFHPNLNRNFFTDFAWTFAAYLETVAVLPQFYLLQKMNKAVESWISHFVFSMGLGRLFLAVFWLSSFTELENKRSKFILGGYEGILILLVQAVHILIMAEFCVIYINSARQQTPLIIPTLDV